MKVLMLNGSSNLKGCTYTALEEVGKTLNTYGIDYEIFQIGATPIRDCIGCGKCRETGKCIFTDDKVNEFLDKVPNTDGFVFGTPVHFAASSGMLSSFMDRVFYGRRNLFKNKLAAAVVSCRRGGATSTFDQINKYFAMIGIPCNVEKNEVSIKYLLIYF